MTISTIIPVYNAASFVEKAVISVLQFSEVKELFLIDDGSTDGSIEICENLASKYNEVQFVQHPDKKNHGVSASRNLGMDMASQEFVTFLDADDHWLPNRFDAEREYFKNEKIEGVFGAIGVEFITEAGKKKYLEVINDTGLTTVKYEAEGMDVFYGLTQIHPDFGTFFSLIATTLRRTVLNEKNLRLNETLKMHEDSDFIIKLAYHFYLKTGSIDKAVAIRTGHENNTFSSVKNFSKEYFRNKEKLYQSLYSWAELEKEMPKEITELFRIKETCAKVAQRKGASKYFWYIVYSFNNWKLLKTRYRYMSFGNYL